MSGLVWGLFCQHGRRTFSGIYGDSAFNPRPGMMTREDGPCGKVTEEYGLIECTVTVIPDFIDLDALRLHVANLGVVEAGTEEAGVL